MSKAAELAKAGETLTNQPSGRKNMVINGAMQVAQRATSKTGIGANGGAYHTLDRIDMFFDATAGRLTMSQAADGPSGFANCLKLDCTTADASIAAGEVAILQYAIEGQDLQQLKKGTSDAEKVTVSFYVKGNANATYTLELQDNDNSRHIAQTFNVTTGWTRVTKTFVADTTDPLDDDNAASLRIQIYLQAGSTYTGGTFTSNTWADIVNGNTVKSDQTMFFDSTDRELFLTGLQLEVGSQATNFEHRSFGEELALCYRYTQRHPSSDSGENFNIIANGFAGSATETFHFCRHYQTMRAEPSLTNNGSFRVRYRATATNVTSATTIHDPGSNMDHTFLVGTVASTQTTGEGSLLEQGDDVDAHILLDAEL